MVKRFFGLKVFMPSELEKESVEKESTRKFACSLICKWHWFFCGFVRRCWQLADWTYLITYLMVAKMCKSNAKLNLIFSLCFLYRFRSASFFRSSFLKQISDEMPIYQSIKLCFEFHLNRISNEQKNNTDWK